jgi:hypothetical protein
MPAASHEQSHEAFRRHEEDATFALSLSPKTFAIRGFFVAVSGNDPLRSFSKSETKDLEFKRPHLHRWIPVVP